MKTFLISCLFATSVAFANQAQASTDGQPDTIVVKLKNADKVLIITPPGANRVRGLREVDLNKILSTVDSTLQSNQVQVYRFGQDGNSFPAPPAPPNMPMPPLPPRLPGLMDTNFIIREIRTSRSNNGVSVNNGRKTFSISIKGRNGITIRERTEDNEDYQYPVFKQYRNGSYKGHYVRSSVTAAFGLNNILTPSGNFPDSDKPYNLSPVDSRYFSLGWKWGHRYYNSRLGFNVGFDFAWQNFALQDAYRLKKGLNGLDFDNYTKKTDSINVQKSKLVVSTLKVPISMAYRVGNLWFVEVGGFVGLRLKSRAKFKYDERGNTRSDNVVSDFYLNNFQYGLNAQIRRRAWGIFGEYQLNPMFNSKGPDLRAFQFGVSFWGI